MLYCNGNISHIERARYSGEEAMRVKAQSIVVPGVAVNTPPAPLPVGRSVCFRAKSADANFG
jgi:hypothetical protein